MILWFYMQKLRLRRVKDLSILTRDICAAINRDPWAPDQCRRQHVFLCGFSWRWRGWESQPYKSWAPWLQQKQTVFGIFWIFHQTGSLVHAKLVKADIRPQHRKLESIIKGKWKSWKQMLPRIKLMGMNPSITQVSELGSRSQQLSSVGF